MSLMEKTLNEIAILIKGTIVGNGDIEIIGITSIESPKEGCLAYITDAKKLSEIEKTCLAALIVPPEIQSTVKPVIQHPHPKVAWAIVLGLFNPARTFPKIISNQAFIAKSAKIGKNVTIEPFSYIGENVTIDEDSVIRSHSYIDEGTSIGKNTVIHPGVVLYPNTKIGHNVAIHAGTVIGTDGFGYVFDGQKHLKVPQVGNVIIEDDVEIGGCVTIDRATIGSTIIGKGTKIDNLVQIAHNVEIGQHSCLSAQTGIAGSSKVGNFVTMGGRVGLADHVEIGDQVMLGAESGVPPGKKIPPKQIWIGTPARPYQEMRKQVGAQLRIAETTQTVRELKKRVEELEKQIENLKKEETKQ